MKLHKQLSILFALIFLSWLFVMPALAQDDDPRNDDTIVVADEDGFDLQDMTWLDWLQTSGIVIIALGVIFIAYRVWQTEGDVGLTRFIDDFQTDRQRVGQVETFLQNSPSQFQLAFNNFEEFMTFVSRFTVMQSDDAFAKLLQDIRTPGAPTSVPTPVEIKASPNDEAPH